jgi:hypothetical protein
LTWYGFAFSSARLQVDDFADIVATKNVMIAANSFCKAQVAKQATKIVKVDIIIRCPAEDSFYCLSGLAH